MQIASGADIRVVAPDARMAIMEMKWGLVPDMGGYQLWRGLVRDDVLRELVYTNREFSGEESLTLGLATFVSDDPLARAKEFDRGSSIWVTGASAQELREALNIR